MIEQNVPVLLVGLGGIGGSIVNKVMEKIERAKGPCGRSSDRYRPR